MADCLIKPCWQILTRLQAVVEEFPHQRLRGISMKEREEIAGLFGMVDLLDATQIELSPIWGSHGWMDTLEKMTVRGNLNTLRIQVSWA